MSIRYPAVVTVTVTCLLLNGEVRVAAGVRGGLVALSRNCGPGNAVAGIGDENIELEAVRRQLGGRRICRQHRQDARMEDPLVIC